MNTSRILRSEIFWKNFYARLLVGICYYEVRSVFFGITSVILLKNGVGRVRNNLNGMPAEVVLFERMVEIRPE